MLKNRNVANGKSVIPIYPSYKFSSMFTIPIRLAEKYNLKQSDIEIEERGDGGLFIKKAHNKTRTRTFLTGKTSCGLTIPAYWRTNTDTQAMVVTEY